MVQKLMISYSDDDRDIALKIRKQLVESGYDVWIAHLDTKGSVDWTQSILDVIDSRDGLVLVWSESATTSENVREEIRLARVFRKPVFPILAHPMERVPSLPNEIRNLQVIWEGDFDSNITELKARLDDPKRSNIPFPKLAEHGYIPKALNPYFIGRSRELKELFVDCRGYRGVTRKGLPIAISGLAGIGKSQLALTFGYRFNLFFPDGVYWVDTPNGIVHEFGKIGPHMGVKSLQDERSFDYARRVLEKLGQLREGLIIFDNVTDLAEFRKWCPEGMTSCSVILTTRMSPRGFRARVMNLTELDSDSAYEMLIARRKDGADISRNELEREALREVCRVTGNHPLALEMCASRLQSDFIKPSDYLKEIQPDPLRRLGNESRPDDSLGAGTASLMEVLRHSYASLNEKLVERYFLLMCCFAPHGINKELIMQAYGEPVEGGDALEQLANFSFIRRELNNSLSLHPLVAQFGQVLQKQHGFDYQSKFVSIMLGFLRAHDNNLASEDVRRETPHIDEALRVAQELKLWDDCADLFEYAAEIVVGLPEQIKSLENAYQIIEQYLPQQKRRLPGLRLRLGKARRADGQVREALDDFSQTESLYREIRDVDPQQAASLRFELGDAYLTLGFYADAGKTLSGALDMAAAAHLDNSAPEVLQLRQALARRALELGDYDKADASLKEILDDRSNFYAAQPDAISAEGLASVYADLSRLALDQAHYSDAVQAANDALAILKNYHKESDPECSQIHLLLGNIHYESGVYGAAEEKLDQARRDFSTTFGERHPNYAKALMALGEVHRKQGKFGTAETEIKSAIEIFTGVYGDSHPSVAEALSVQAKIYDHQCRFKEEQEVWERVLRIQRQFYSEQHPALANTHYDYASLFWRKGEYARAAEHLQSSLAITEQNFSKKHVEYFGRLIRLATCFYEQQEYLQAQEVLDDAGGLQHDIFGETPHPYIARMLQLQSEILRRRGEFDEAMKAIDNVIAMKKVIYGREDHPSVAEALEVKVKIYHHLGEKVEAKSLIEDALRIRRNAYGDAHPEVSRSIHDLGSYYLRLGQFAAAIEQFEKAREITASVFGPGHPDYVERTLHLANARNEQGEYLQALKLVEDVETALPAGNHYLTARWLQLMGELQRRVGKFDIAMGYIERAIDMKKAIYGPDDHPSLAEALEVQAKIFDHQCKFDDEKKVWERVLRIERKFYSDQHPALANTHYDYSSLFLRKGEYGKAAEHVKESLRITEHNFGKTHADYFGSLGRLAICYYEQQEYVQAQEVLDEAKTLQGPIFGTSPHPYIARMLQLQSEILRRRGEFDKALQAIDDAIAVKKQLYGTEEHPSIAEAFEVKVKIFHHLGEKADAKQLVDRALEIRRNAYGVNHPEVSRSIHDLGSYYLRLGQYEAAATQFEQARQITAEVFGKAHPDYVERTLNLASARNEQGEYPRALELAKEIETALPAGNHYITARWLQLMGELQRRLGQFDAALDFINQAIAMKKAIYDTEDHPSVAEALAVQAKIYDHQCKFDEEQKVWERILKIQRQFYSERHPALATTHYDYANLFMGMGKYGEAAEHLHSSLEITEQNFGKSHASYFGRLILQAACLYEQQQYLQAQKVLEEAGGLQQEIFHESQHPYIARMLQLQSEILRQLGEFDKALKAIDDAIAMKKAIYGREEHPSVAEALEVKVDLMLRQLQLEDSSPILDRIEHIRFDSYGKSHPAYANYQMRRAEWYELAGQYDEAGKILEQSLQTCLEAFAADHPETIGRQLMLARMARKANHIGDAENRINSARETLGARLETEDSLIVAETYEVLSYIRYAQGYYREALAALEKALRIKTRIFGSESPSVIELYDEKAKLMVLFHHLDEATEIIESALHSIKSDEPLYKRLKSDLLTQRGILQDLETQYDRAYESIEEAIELRKGLIGVSDVELARLYIEKAVVLRHQCKYNEALANLEAAHNIDNFHFDENHIYFARILLEQGQTYLDKRNALAAQEHLKEALKIYGQQPNRNIKQHADAAEALGRNYLENGLLRDASASFKVAMDIRTVIYGDSHPEIARTLYRQAQVLLKTAETGKGEDMKTEAAQKLRSAQNMLEQSSPYHAELKAEIQRTLATL